jgi:hypothetical protein
LFAVARRDADPHRSAQSGGARVPEQPLGNDRIADQVELRFDGDPVQSESGALLEFPEDGELARR